MRSTAFFLCAHVALLSISGCATWTGATQIVAAERELKDQNWDACLQKLDELEAEEKTYYGRRKLLLRGQCLRGKGDPGADEPLTVLVDKYAKTKEAGVARSILGPEGAPPTKPAKTASTSTAKKKKHKKGDPTTTEAATDGPWRARSTSPGLGKLVVHEQQAWVFGSRGVHVSDDCMKTARAIPLAAEADALPWAAAIHRGKAIVASFGSDRKSTIFRCTTKPDTCAPVLTVPDLVEVRAGAFGFVVAQSMLSGASLWRSRDGIQWSGPTPLPAGGRYVTTRPSGDHLVLLPSPSGGWSLHTFDGARVTSDLGAVAHDYAFEHDGLLWSQASKGYGQGGNVSFDGGESWQPHRLDGMQTREEFGARPGEPLLWSRRVESASVHRIVLDSTQGTRLLAPAPPVLQWGYSLATCGQDLLAVGAETIWAAPFSSLESSATPEPSSTAGAASTPRTDILVERTGEAALAWEDVAWPFEGDFVRLVGDTTGFVAFSSSGADACQAWSSVDQGRTWKKGAAVPGCDVVAVRATLRGNTLLMITRDGLQRSVDLGARFKPVEALQGAAAPFTIRPAGRALYAEQQDNQVLRSDDDGATWTPATAADMAPFSVVWRSGRGAGDVVVTYGGKAAFRVSRDGGKSWKRAPFGEGTFGGPSHVVQSAAGVLIGDTLGFYRLGATEDVVERVAMPRTFVDASCSLTGVAALADGTVLVACGNHLAALRP